MKHALPITILFHSLREGSFFPLTRVGKKTKKTSPPATTLRPLLLTF